MVGTLDGRDYIGLVFCHLGDVSFVADIYVDSSRPFLLPTTLYPLHTNTLSALCLQAEVTAAAAISMFTLSKWRCLEI